LRTWLLPGMGYSKAESKVEDLEQGLRQQLEDWNAAGAMKSPEQVQDVIHGLSASYKMDPQAVKMIWLTVARQIRPEKGSTAVYPALAQKHHNTEVEVVDLGQYSEKHNNSCMFLSCAAAVADRRLQGYDDARLIGMLGDMIEACAPFMQTSSIPELVEEHSRGRDSVLGRMADALRHAACEVLHWEEDFYLPFFHPVHISAESDPSGHKAEYKRWVQKMRGNEEGDELVILALARLCGMAVQPVQQSGYRVPLMDPTDSAKKWITYWGNDDKHWVWLKPTKG